MDDKTLREKAKAIFNDGSNWNNGDKTSGQYVYSEDEIYNYLDSSRSIIKWLAGKDYLSDTWESVMEDYAAFTTMLMKHE